MMTHQEIFAKVATHLLKQNAKSFRVDETSCAYRGDNGNTCAVGHLIADSAYSPSLESLSVRDPAVINALQRSGVLAGAYPEDVPLPTMDLLGRLQVVHDAQDAYAWQSALQQQADLLGLTMPDLP